MGSHTALWRGQVRVCLSAVLALALGVSVAQASAAGASAAPRALPVEGSRLSPPPPKLSLKTQYRNLRPSTRGG